MEEAWWWTRLVLLGSAAAWALAGATTAVLVLAGQEAPRAFANACLVVAGIFACGVLFRFGGSALRSSRVLKTPPTPDGDERGGSTPAEARPASRPQRYGISAPPRSDRASFAFAILATLVMIQVLVLGFVVGTKA